MRLSTLTRCASYASAAGALYWGIRSFRTTDRIVSSLFWNNAAILSLGALTLNEASTRRIKNLQREGFKNIKFTDVVQGAALAGAAFCLYRGRSAFHLEEQSRYHTFAGLLAAVSMVYQIEDDMREISNCGMLTAFIGSAYWMYHQARTTDLMVKSLYSINGLLFNVGGMIALEFSTRKYRSLKIGNIKTLTFSELIAGIKRIKATDWIKIALLAGTVFCLYRGRAADHLPERLQCHRFATALAFVPLALIFADVVRDWRRFR